MSWRSSSPAEVLSIEIGTSHWIIFVLSTTNWINNKLHSFGFSIELMTIFQIGTHITGISKMHIRFINGTTTKTLHLFFFYFLLVPMTSLPTSKHVIVPFLLTISCWWLKSLLHSVLIYVCWLVGFEKFIMSIPSFLCSAFILRHWISIVSPVCDLVIIPPGYTTVWPSIGHKKWFRHIWWWHHQLDPLLDFFW